MTRLSTTLAHGVYGTAPETLSAVAESTSSLSKSHSNNAEYIVTIRDLLKEFVDSAMVM